LGPAPLQALFEVAADRTRLGFAGLRAVALDGLNSLKAPGTSRNRV
jgi:hypothetical protein